MANQHYNTNDGLKFLALCLFLTFFGMLMIYSSSATTAAQKFSNPTFFVEKQFIGFAISCLAILLVYRLPLRFIERMTLPVLVFSLLSLALLFIPGVGSTRGGAARWISIFGFSFQPGEFAKIALVLFFAKNMGRPHFRIQNFNTGILPNVLVYAAFASLLLFQPDLGTAFLLGVLTLLYLFVAGMNWRYVLLGISSTLILLVLAILAAPYRMKRIFSFIDPWGTIQEGGFQIIQSFLAFKNGGLTGVGLGLSKQKLYFLPEAHCDFILALIAEELGLFGVVALCFAFFYLTYLGFLIMQKQTNKYRQLLVFGLISLISFQAFFNMAVTMGLAPTKGISLPFISAGSNSLIVFLCCAAIIAKLDKEASFAAKNTQHFDSA